MRIIKIIMAMAILFGPSLSFAGSMAVLVPSQPIIEKNLDKKDAEVDMLLGLMEPFPYTAQEMDRPQMFAVIVQDPGEDGNFISERIDLLGDLEEIRHLDTKSWGANVALEKPGMYHFIMESKPWWDESSNSFLHQQAKVVLPVFYYEDGWNLPAGQQQEIIPLTRPFGLTAPALFSGLILRDGKPQDNQTVEMGFVNSFKFVAPTEAHKSFKTKTNALGQFSFVLNHPGWWYCKVDMPGDPLKGPDGAMKPVTRSSLLWLYVDNFEKLKKK